MTNQIPTTDPTHPAYQMFNGASTEKLIGTYRASNDSTDPEAPRVRGWLLDELDARHPNVFAAWCDAQDAGETAELMDMYEAAAKAAV